MTEPKVVIALPAYGQIPATSAVTLCGVMADGVAKGLCHGLVYATNAMVDWARNHLVGLALEHHSEPTHIMWVDGDMVIPQDAIARLLEHDKDIVSGLYFQRTEPHLPVVYTLDPFEITTDLDFENLSQVEGLGMGCMLARTEVYREMEKHFSDQRWHMAEWPNGGEDVWFFRRCKEMGIESFLDPTVLCGHVREQVVTMEDWKR